GRFRARGLLALRLSVRPAARSAAHDRRPGRVPGRSRGQRNLGPRRPPGGRRAGAPDRTGGSGGTGNRRVDPVGLQEVLSVEGVEPTVHFGWWRVGTGGYAACRSLRNAGQPGRGDPGRGTGEAGRLRRRVPRAAGGGGLLP